ncbi:MAG: hypothetical protein K1X54_14620, partial [Flavobacteriales bacterium]|nr:hypothetical protein [Flavobacteriales bacterium]
MPVFLFFQTGTRDLMMVPGLLLHFLEHKSHEPELTFADFMHTHYCKDFGHRHEHNHCGHLPFADDDLPLPHFQVIEEQLTELVFAEFIVVEPQNSHYSFSLRNPDPLGFWQP